MAGRHWPRILAVGLFLVVFVAPRMFVPARSPASLAGVTDPAARGRLEDERLKLQHDVRIDQLGSEQLDVRLGGIYGLERIAARGAEAATAAAGAYQPPGSEDPPGPLWWAAQDRVQVVEILSAYVRTTSHRPPVGPVGPPTSRSGSPTCMPP